MIGEIIRNVMIPDKMIIGGIGGHGETESTKGAIDNVHVLDPEVRLTTERDVVQMIGTHTEGITHQIATTAEMIEIQIDEETIEIRTTDEM